MEKKKLMNIQLKSNLFFKKILIGFLYDFITFIIFLSLIT
jgi:hypothetical protein